MKAIIIDDDNFIRKVYKEALAHSNIQATAFGKATEGLEKIKSTKPDVVLLDMMLPDMSGFDILQELQKDEELKKIPVVVISSLSQQSDIDEAMSLGAKKYLPKGEWGPDKVVEEIEKLLQ